VLNAKWEFSSHIPSKACMKVFHSHGQPAPTPNVLSLFCATVCKVGKHWKLSGYGLIQGQPTLLPDILTWFQQLQFSQDWEVEIHMAGSWPSSCLNYTWAMDLQLAMVHISLAKAPLHDC